MQKHPNCVCRQIDMEYDAFEQCRDFREGSCSCMHCHGFLLKALLRSITGEGMPLVEKIERSEGGQFWRSD